MCKQKKLRAKSHLFHVHIFKTNIVIHGLILFSYLLHADTGFQLTHQLALLMTSAAPSAVFDISRQLKMDIKQLKRLLLQLISWFSVFACVKDAVDSGLKKNAT